MLILFKGFLIGYNQWGISPYGIVLSCGQCSTCIALSVSVVLVGFVKYAVNICRYVFGIDMDEDGGLHECIGCPNESDYCTEECRIYKKYQKRLARMEEDKEQERYLQEYTKRKQEKKNRKEGKR